MLSFSATIPLLLLSAIGCQLFAIESRKDDLNGARETFAIPLSYAGEIKGPQIIIGANRLEIGKRAPDAMLIFDNVVKCGDILMVSYQDASSSLEKSLDPEHEMEKIWKKAYDFVPGLGISSPMVTQTFGISFPNMEQWANEYLWLGDIEIGGMHENELKNNTQYSLDELIQADIERVKIKKHTTPYENLGGQGDDFINIIKVESCFPADAGHIPRGGGRVFLKSTDLNDLIESK